MTSQPAGATVPGTAYGVDVGSGLVRVVRAEIDGTFSSWQRPTPVRPGGAGRGTPDDAALPTLLRPRIEAARRVVAAVPHGWLVDGTDLSDRAAGPGGEPSREPVAVLRAALSACDAPGAELVSAPLAALVVPAVRAALPGRRETVVIADLGPGHCELVACDVNDKVPRVLARVSTETSGTCPDPHWALARAGLPDDAPYEERLQVAQDLIARLSQDDADTSALALARARQERADRARGDGPDDIRLVWQRVPVYRNVVHPDEGRLSLDTGQVLDLLDTLAAPLRDLAAALRQNHPDVRGAGLLVLGGGSVFAPLVDAVRQGLGLPEDAPMAIAPDPVLAVAQGAALVASGAAELPVFLEAARPARASGGPAPADAPRRPAPPARLAVTVHRRVGGELCEWLAVLPRPASRPEFLVDPFTGAEAVVDWGGPASLSLWIRPPGADGFAPAAVDAARVPAGRYRVGAGLDDRAGPVLVLAGADGTGPTLSVPVTDAAHGTPAAGRTGHAGEDS
ncbi:hypothetical protein ACFZAD_21060 [Streptomyces iakyrus]|uniref:hypothetical protein n=1 Tax=Streptomyces iakyrus TaxID=68219 RepID=UPI0036E5E02E